MEFHFDSATHRLAARQELEAVAAQARAGALTLDELLAAIPRSQGAYLVTVMMAAAQAAVSQPEARAAVRDDLRREVLRPTNRVRIAETPFTYAQVALLLYHELAADDPQAAGFITAFLGRLTGPEHAFVRDALENLRLLDPPEQEAQEAEAAAAEQQPEPPPEPEPPPQQPRGQAYWNDDLP